jgi:hypothetical protein
MIPRFHAAHVKQHSLQCAWLIGRTGSATEGKVGRVEQVALSARSPTNKPRRIRREWLCGRGSPRLKWLKMRTRQEKRDCRASVRHIHRHRNAFIPLPDYSPLRQVVADRTIRSVIATLRVCGCYRGLVLRGKLTTLVAVLLLGMVNAGEVVQLATQQRRYT